jgi:hypothetical protein
MFCLLVLTLSWIETEIIIVFRFSSRLSQTHRQCAVNTDSLPVCQNNMPQIFRMREKTSQTLLSSVQILSKRKGNFVFMISL